MALGLAACGGGSDAKSGGHASKQPVVNVNYLTSFNTFGRDAYAYVAQEKGYFEEAGLKVDIKPGTGTVDVLKLIASGRADFGIGDFTTTVITAANESLPVTTTAMIHQSSLAAIISLEGQGITKPADLEGKKIGDQPGSTNQVMFPVYARAAGIDASKVQFVPGAPPALPQLLVAGQVDGIGQFVVGQPLIEKAAKGKKAVVLPYGDLVPDLYGNALVTSRKFASEKPDVVKRFNEALLKGLKYSIEHPDETGTILKKYQPTQDAQVAAAEVTAMASYVKPRSGAAGEIGSVDRDRVEKIVKLLVEAGSLKQSVPADDVVSFSLAPGAK
ncbi:ABC transporter substrate-binding protein [Planosporangium sp. 12N6]|uniref:ABC transporter substrate-binding protein n=1 Tax=Planosporangium spinosum TaxID=3402278 RepID=UPI003CFA57BE